MHIIVLVDSYYPNFTMNGIITRNIINELKDEHNMSIITFKDHYGQSDIEIHDQTEIHRIVNHNICIDNYLKKRIYQNSSGSFLPKIGMMLKKIFFYIKRNWRLIGLDIGICNKIESCLRNINRDKPIDLVISISAPYEMNYCGLKATEINSNIKLIPIQLDFFSQLDDKYYIRTLKALRKEKRMYLEKRIIEKCTMYFALDFLKKYFQVEEFEKYKEKIQYCQHPLIKRNSSNVEVKNIFEQGEKINLVYTGSLSKSERNPKELFEILGNVSSDFSFCLNIFHRGDCNAIVEDYKKLMGNKIKNWGSVDSETAYGAMNYADVLVSIGTIQGNQVAGKTFDYISTGKPIIYIYYSCDDENFKYFKSYPLALCLNVNELAYKECANKIVRFCNETKNKNISFSEIEDIYYKATPAYVVKNIIECAN